MATDATPVASERWQGEPTVGTSDLGIHHWATQGIIGRGVLVDLAAASEFDPFERRGVEPEDFEAVLRQQGTTLRYGDILCVRFGWVEAHRSLDERARRDLANRCEQRDGREWAGLSAGEETSRFLWDQGVSAVACDNPAVEVAPGDPATGSLHRRLIPCLGFVLGELRLFCLIRGVQESGRYEFLFVSVPLNVPGGVGSPASAVAVL